MNVAVGSVGFILIMVGRTGWDLLVYVGSFLLDLTLALILAPKFGANGAAVAQSVTLTVTNAVRLFLVWRFVRIQPFSRLRAPPDSGGDRSACDDRNRRAALRRCVAGDLIVTGLVGLVIYVPALIAFGLTPGERNALRRATGKRRRHPHRAGGQPQRFGHRRISVADAHHGIGGGFVSRVPPAHLPRV